MKAPTRSQSVSVALGTFGVSPYLDDQIKSIVDQTEAVGEIVVSDDGSGSDVGSYVRERVLASGSKADVRVVGTSRAGGVARNFARAIQACSGDFIALSDHDDVWLPNKLEVMLRTIRDKDLAFSDAVLVDGAGLPIQSSLFGAYRVSVDELRDVEGPEALSILLKRNIVTGATVLVRRELAQRALPIGTGWIHDEWLAVAAATSGGIAVCREPTIHYRIHGTNQIGIPRSPGLGEFVNGLRAGSARYKTDRTRILALMRLLAKLDADPKMVSVGYQRLEFDNARLKYPAAPTSRWKPIQERWTRGDYERFALDPRAERWRDLLQRP